MYPPSQPSPSEGGRGYVSQTPNSIVQIVAIYSAIATCAERETGYVSKRRPRTPVLLNIVNRKC